MTKNDNYTKLDNDMWQRFKKHKNVPVGAWYPVAVLLLVSLCWSWVVMVNVAIITPDTTIGLLVAAAAFFVLVLLSTSIFIVGIGVLRRRSQKLNIWSLLGLFFLWAFLEWSVSWLIAVVWYGDGGSVDTVLPFSSFTPFLMYTPLKYLARFVGFHGLSAVFVMLCVVTVSKKLRHVRLPIYLMVSVLTAVAYVGYIGSHNRTASVTMVSEYLEYPVPIHSPQSDLVLLPEYGLDTLTDETLVQRFPAGFPLAFIGSKQQLVADGGTRNKLIYGEGGHFVKEIDKSRLIPGGEYLPYVVDKTLSVTGNDSTRQSFLYRRKVLKGDASLQPLVLPSGQSVGAMVCSSIIATEDYRLLTKRGATILTNSASLGIFHGSPVFEVQHGGFARFMAVANVRPFVQSSSFGAAFALNHNGNIIARAEPGNATDVQVVPVTQKTPYTVFGEWPVVFGGLFVFTGVLAVLRKKVTKKHQA